MQTRTVDQIQGWSSRPFSGGYGGLHELAAAGFSGAVSADGAWLFMLNGHAIGVAEGSVETFERASGTAYSAPDDALPLLFAMVERGGEKRGQYYTERTPLSEVDKTLSQGGFTGYVELSENVLSGDYYVVYYGGTPMHAAFVGQSERLLTGEEAHERAAEEVGLYDVVAVDLSILDLPDPPEDSAVVGGGTVAADDATNGTATDRPIDESTVDDPSAETAGAPSPSEPSPSTTEAGDLDLESTLTGESAADETPPPEADAPMDDTATPDRPEPAPEPEGTVETAAESETAERQAVDAEEEASDPDGSDRTPEGDSTDQAVAASLDDVELADSVAAEEPTPSEEPAPPDDPTVSGDLATAVEEVEADEEPPTTPGQPTDTESTPEEAAGSQESDDTDDEESASELDDLFAGTEEPASGHEFAGATRGPAVEEDRATAADDDRVAELEERLRALDAEREELAEERADLAEERDRLQARVAELETEVAASKPPADFEQVSPQAALEATDLFVRYRSKSAATLEDAHAGADNHDAVRQNLDLEHHTRFDATRTAVGDDEYEQFLPSTLEHDLTTWLVADLLYEIRDTGHVDGLRPLYDALPRIDRADLYGAVEVSGEEGADSVAFDVVCRDRLGNPLVCLDVHDSREPATDGEMDAVLQKSARVGEEHDEFACAFLVTSSFFEPSALELATERTASGGLFGGSKRESFVKLSRKRGYHLCLVEARDRRFHLTLPEL